MLFLIGQIAFFLLIATLVGVIIGWLIARSLYIQKMAETKLEWEGELLNKQLEIETLQNVLNKNVMKIAIL